MICEYCRKIIRRKPVLLINKQQTLSTRIFCSKRCKDWWCLSSQRKKSRSVITWCIGKYLHDYFFIKKVVNKKDPDSKVTYFSEKLNHIEELELSGSKILRVRKANAS